MTFHGEDLWRFQGQSHHPLEIWEDWASHVRIAKPPNIVPWSDLRFQCEASRDLEFGNEQAPVYSWLQKDAV
jgi:hypothetical protein